MLHTHAATKPVTRAYPIFVSLIVFALMGCGDLFPQQNKSVRRNNPNATNSGDATSSEASGGAGGQPASLMGARVIRLSNAEFVETSSQLLGMTAAFNIVESPRQFGFTNNADIRIDGVVADQIRTQAESLAIEATSKNPALLDCKSGNQVACGESFIRSFASRAFRRPLTDDDVSPLIVLFQSGLANGGYKQGIELVISTILQSPDFIYRTELGTSQTDQEVELTAHEKAQALAYTMTGLPPDTILRAKADSGQLNSREEAGQEAKRLLETPAGKATVKKFIHQWLGLDQPTEAPLDKLFRQEADMYLEEVIFTNKGDLKELLTANYTFANGELAAFYGISGGSGGFTRIDLSSSARRGILTQGLFLARYSHGEDSAPVIRGLTIRKKLLCQTLPSPPPSIAAKITVPLPNPTMSTRQRFTQHSSDPSCSGCHKAIDPPGFAFENFNGVGLYRTMDNGSQVDASGVLYGVTNEPQFNSAADMMNILSEAKEVEECFAKYLFRHISYQNGDPTEAKFLEFIASIDPNLRTRIYDVLIEYAKSDLFSRRRN